MTKLEYFFDCSSPWTYLGFETVQTVAAETGVEIDWRPILVGGIFNRVNNSVYIARETPDSPKMRYNRKDMQDWARHQDLKILWPPSIFPVNSVKAMRACLIAGDQGKLVPFARAAFQAYWSEDRDIADPGVLVELAQAAGLDGEALLAAIADQAVKDRLRGNTDELIDRGGFGSPTIFIDGDDMYFGNDRMDFVRAAIRRRQAAA